MHFGPSFSPFHIKKHWSKPFLAKSNIQTPTSCAKNNVYLNDSPPINVLPTDDNKAAAFAEIKKTETVSNKSKTLKK